MADSMFWPVMTCQSLAIELDANNQPNVVQHYSVPTPQPDKYESHDKTIYSMWMHFIDACVGTHRGQKHACYSGPDEHDNLHTGCSRLPIFQLLSQSESLPLSRAQILVYTPKIPSLTTSHPHAVHHQIAFDSPLSVTTCESHTTLSIEYSLTDIDVVSASSFRHKRDGSLDSLDTFQYS
jgi:hypothetical protein